MSDQSRIEILNKIAATQEKRVAAISAYETSNDSIYQPVLPDMVSCFRSEIEAINGKCIVCTSDEALIQHLKEIISEKQLSSIFCMDKKILNFLKSNDINCSNEVSDFTEMQAGITSCEFLVARTGSVIVSSAGDSGRRMNVFPPIHLVLANSAQLVQFPEDALVAVQSKYKNNLPSTVTTITGPSRTADIEKTLVLGAHGPKELVVFLSLV